MDEDYKKMQQALIEYLLHIKNEAQKFPMKSADTLIYAEAMKKTCEAVLMVSINSYQKKNDFTNAAADISTDTADKISGT